MEMQINHNEPTVMHIDLNSCFATVEQQANPLLRGKPIAVAAYDSPGGCVLAPSYEAKAYGVKTGMRVRDAKLLCKDLIVMMPDPPKYRDVHLKLKKLFYEYTSDVTPKSIDEAVLDMKGTTGLKRGLVSIGEEIKKRIRAEIGEWLRVNVGIAPNRFLAKLAASLHKPDGLDVITHDNLRDVYSNVTLVDLNGINTRFEARLNTYGIFTPIQFLEAPLQLLRGSVFKSICGYYWYLRLRGWEIDDVEYKTKSYGQSYALKEQTADTEKLAPLLMKLSEKMGRRLRRSNQSAYGIHLSLLYKDYSHWHKGVTFNTPLYSTNEIFTKVLYLMNLQPQKKIVHTLAVSCYGFDKVSLQQETLFETNETKQQKIADAIDKINDKYGEYIVTPALMMGLGEKIIDRVPFGGVKELEDIYYNN